MVLAAVDPGITPNANFPFLESLKQIGGGILVGAFIVIAIVAIIGAAMLLAGKLSQSSQTCLRRWGDPAVDRPGRGNPRRHQRLHTLVSDGLSVGLLAARDHAYRV